jgi:hypothetical protein
MMALMASLRFLQLKEKEVLASASPDSSPRSNRAQRSRLARRDSTSFAAEAAGRLLDGPRTVRALRSYSPALASRWATPERQFVVVTAGRTGSELLVSLLDSHPLILCDSEILAERRSFPSQILKGRLAIAGLRSCQAYGFKLLGTHFRYFQLGPPETCLRHLHECGWQIILLERSDLLQQAISHLRAAGTRYHYHRGDAVTFSPMVIDPMAVVATMFILEEDIDFLRSALTDVPHLRLVYEDHLGRPDQQQQTIERICSQLGVRTAPATSDLVKITPHSTADQVVNFRELANALTGTRYENYISRLEAGQARSQPEHAEP